MSSWMKGMVTAAAVASGVAATTQVLADDVFIKIDGVTGESQDAKHKGEVEALAWSWGVVQSGAKPQISDIAITKRFDKASLVLAQVAATGRHIKTVTLVVRRSQAEYIKMTLDDVVVSSIKMSGEASRNTETVSLNFSRIKMDYSPQKPDGSLDAAISFNWDVRSGKM